MLVRIQVRIVDFTAVCFSTALLVFFRFIVFFASFYITVVSSIRFYRC